MSRPAPRRGAPQPQDGFSILELLVALATSLLVIGAMLTMFHESGKMARTQTWVADMQDSLRFGQQRMVRTARMAGRGGIPLGNLPAGLALEVRNDAPATGDARYIAAGDATSPPIMEGTDVLVVRGVISTPIYQLGRGAGDFTVDDFDAPTSGSIRIRSPHPTSGITQDLTTLAEALLDDDHPALVLVGPLDDWAVVEIDTASSDLTSLPDDVTLAFVVGDTSGTGVADRYLQLSGGYPQGLRTVTEVALLEEHRFYIREDYTRDADETSQLSPRLSQVRFYPNTEVPHASNPDAISEIADNIVDLQIAIGVDTDGDGRVDEGTDSATKATDDWLFNDPGDVGGDGLPTTPTKWLVPGARLHYLRITALARTDRPDLTYKAPALIRTEDREFGPGSHERFNDTSERRYRRRLLQTIVDMRNL